MTTQKKGCETVEHLSPEEMAEWRKKHPGETPDQAQKGTCNLNSDPHAQTCGCIDWVPAAFVSHELHEGQAEKESFLCAARHSQADPPQDCNWPFCGCDTHADKVIEALLECGWGSAKFHGSDGARFRRGGVMIWSIVDCEFRRRGKPIAQAVKLGDVWGWKWIGDVTTYREGFATKDEMLADVKYFHRYNPPRLTLTFQSGRKLSFR
jgi:hypothetical protein